MISPSGWLVVVYHYRMVRITGSGSVDPHVTAPAGLSAIGDHFEGCFIRVDERSVQEMTVEFITQDGEVLIARVDHPV